MGILIYVFGMFAFWLWVVNKIGSKFPLLSRFFNKFPGLISIALAVYGWHGPLSRDATKMGVGIFFIATAFVALFQMKIYKKLASFGGDDRSKNTGWFSIDVCAALIAFITFFFTDAWVQTNPFYDYWGTVMPFLVATVTYEVSKYVTRDARKKAVEGMEGKKKKELMMGYIFVGLFVAIFL